MHLHEFLRPLYQDLDGVSRWNEVERIGRIARSLYPGGDRELELLLLFQGLGKWLDRVGNLSRTVLATGVDEGQLRRTAESIRRLDAPESDAERAVAAALRIDRAGVHGLTQRFAQARREGQSLLDVVREALADAWVPAWMPENGREWLEGRLEARRRVCEEILRELALEDSTSAAPRPSRTPSRR